VGAHPSDFPPHSIETCASERLLNKEGFESFHTCSRHVLMTLEFTNK